MIIANFSSLLYYRLTFEYDSLQKVEADQRLTIEKLSNNESWAKNIQRPFETAIFDYYLPLPDMYDLL